jgi:hypothetical protein
VKAAALVVLLLWVVAPAAAQIDSAAARPDSLRRDSVALARAQDSVLYGRPPITPMAAMWRSLLLPGWGQARLNRKLTGALFVTWEGVTLGMSIKTGHELSYLRRTGSARHSSKLKENQDWLVLLGFNHLFAAIEAYVSAHLWDFPQDLQIRAVPVPRGVGATVSLPFRIP